MRGGKQAATLFAHYKQVALDATVIMQERGHITLADNYRTQIEAIAEQNTTVQAFAAAAYQLLIVVNSMLDVCDTIDDLKDIRPYVDKTWKPCASTLA